MRALYTDSLNVGLPYRFTLDGGKFLLEGGTKKVDDNLWMFLDFEGHFRVYFEDFVPSFMKLLQRPTSYIENMKVAILGGMYASFKKYLIYLTMEKANILYNLSSDRKQYGLVFQYRYNLQSKDSTVKIKEIKV